MIAGQVGVCHGPAPWSFGALVSLVTHSTAYHTVTAISETECVSPEWQGAIVRPISHFPKITFTRFQYTNAQREDVVAWARVRIKRPYSWFDDAVIGLHCLTGLPIPRWLGRLMSNDRSYMCSEFAACAVFFGAGLRPFPSAYPGETSPADWDNYIKEQGWDSKSAKTIPVLVKS